MTLGEVMIASSVLLVTLTALAGLLLGSLSSSGVSKIRDAAANLANERIEAARSLAYDRVGLRYANGTYGDPAGDILTPETVGAFTVVTDCSWIRTSDGRAAYKRVSINVSWTQPIPGHVDVTTMVYGKSDIVTSGDLLVKLRYREDAAPIQNQSVGIRTADGSTRGVTSDNKGEAFFGHIAVGAVAVTVNPPSGYIVDSLTTSNISVSADAVTTVIVYLQRPAQATIHVMDTTGAAVSGAAVTLRRADGALSQALTTDGSGNVTFTGLLYNDYTAAAAKTGYSAQDVPFTLTSASSAPTVNLNMSSVVGVSIRARVFDVNATPLSGATVTLRRTADGAFVGSGTTGTNGEYSFSGLTAGSYSLLVDKTGYWSQSRNDYYDDGDSDVIDTYLWPSVSKGNMHIITRDKNSHPRSIRVVVSGNGYYSDDQWSDYDGSLYLWGLTTGSYQVQCYTDPASVATVIVNGNQTAEVAIAQAR